jgi:hypothetical protein
VRKIKVKKISINGSCKRETADGKIISLLSSVKLEWVLTHLENALSSGLVRGQKVERALNILRFSSKAVSRKLENCFVRYC